MFSSRNRNDFTWFCIGIKHASLCRQRMKQVNEKMCYNKKKMFSKYQNNNLHIKNIKKKNLTFYEKIWLKLCWKMWCIKTKKRKWMFPRISQKITVKNDLNQYQTIHKLIWVATNVLRFFSFVLPFITFIISCR